MRNLFSLAALLSVTPVLMMASAAIALGQAAVSDSTSSSPSPQTLLPNPPESEPLATPGSQLPSVQEMDEMFKETPLGKAADEARLHAEWRDLANRTANDGDLMAMRQHAEASFTDLEKRKRLRVYYTTYFDRMRAKAVSQELKDYIDERKTEQLTVLAQDRVRPGGTPAPTAGPSPSAMSSPAKKKHKKHSTGPEPALPQ